MKLIYQSLTKISQSNLPRGRELTALPINNIEKENSMIYIQRKSAGYLETVDAFSTIKEAREMLKEYQLSDSSAEYYLSRRACKAWDA